MDSLWSDAEAREFVDRYAAKGLAEDIALRVYTSRLLGRDPRLVQHGGGNTSLKTSVQDLLDRPTPAICVKGSGWDMEFIEPAGLPALRLQPLLDLRSVERLSDEDMVNAQRCALLDAGAPTPSVETLLHAWIPEIYIDHTHANAVLALTNQPDGEAICREVYGSRVAIAPYCMPGFQLAHLAARTYADNPGAVGMVLLKHGVFTWGSTAQEAYERMIELVSIAERRIPARPKTEAAPSVAPALDAAVFLPRLRGALTRASGRRVVLDLREGPATRAYVDRSDLDRVSQAGVATPDHVIRTKPWPMILDVREREPEEVAASSEAAVAAFAERYRAYFERGNARPPFKKPLDPWPRVVLAPGLGLVGIGARRKDAAVAADIAETTVDVVSAAERMSRFQSICEQDIFDMEHWSLEQAKLGKSTTKRLAGCIVAITGGAGAIGAATGRAFAAEDAEVVLLDLDEQRALEVAAGFGASAIACDVTDARSVSEAFAAIVRRFGGLDVLVSNAGAAFTGPIGEVSEETLRASFELNFFGHQRCAQEAMRIFRAQGVGGCLLFNASKQALNPGPDFGPYGAAKSAALFLSRQYALEYGAEGVRSNAVNADRIRSGLLTGDMVAERAAARGVSEADYMSGNLLRREVTAADVAGAFVWLALAEKTTGALVTVDGGNIAAAPR
ncbi:bifunctional aldolase/short-chain dehydrogenase [bacterium]|nr:bifunctional aldolase/short-chain dehydrogenase [bacterium]